MADCIITAVKAVNGQRALDDDAELPDDIISKFSAWGWLVLNICEVRPHIIVYRELSSGRRTRSLRD